MYKICEAEYRGQRLFYVAVDIEDNIFLLDGKGEIALNPDNAFGALKLSEAKNRIAYLNQRNEEFSFKTYHEV